MQCAFFAPFANAGAASSESANASVRVFIAISFVPETPLKGLWAARVPGLG
jgi:hypothetical protein